MTAQTSTLLAKAGDPLTPPAELDRIANPLLASFLRGGKCDSCEGNALAVVAANPNTSPALLVSLAEWFPAAVASNPALSLLAFADPRLVARVPASVMKRLVAEPDLPLEWLDQASGHSSVAVRAAVAASARAPASALARLCCDGERNVCFIALSNPSSPPHALAARARTARVEAGTSGWSSELVAIARNPSSSPDLLASLADLPGLVPALLENPSLPLSLIETFVAHEQPTLRSIAAAHATLPARLVAALAVDPAAIVRAALARRPDLPPTLLEALAIDEDASVRSAVASRAKLPAFLTQRLAFDNDPAVRRSVASRPDLSARLSHQLVSDAKAPVRAALARHSTNAAVLRRLAKAREGAVRDGVRSNRFAPAFVRDLGRRRVGGPCSCGLVHQRITRPRSHQSSCTFRGAPSRLAPRARVAPHAGGLARALGRP
jgi:hypothetical protein